MQRYPANTSTFILFYFFLFLNAPNFNYPRPHLEWNIH